MKKSLKYSLFLVVSMAVVITILGFGKEKQYDPIGQYIQIEKTKEGLQSYKEKKNKEQKDKLKTTDLGQKIATTITFNNYLNHSQVQKLITDYGLEVEYLVARTIERETGLKGTVTVPVTELSDDTKLKSLLQRNEADVKGYIEAVAFVPSIKFELLMSDKNVFLADASADNAFSHNPAGEKAQGLFWSLEKENVLEE